MAGGRPACHRACGASRTIRHFDRGLAALGTLPEGAARDAREIELLLASGLAHFAAKGFSAAEAARAYARERWGDVRQLRAATGLARMWGNQGRRAEASDLLAAAYGWFTEGFGTADLKEAKQLLDELA